MKRFKLAVAATDAAPPTAPLLLKGTITENLRTAARLGYDAIEVHTREDAWLPYDEIKEVMKETGTVISDIITGRLNTEGKCSLIDDRPYVTAACVEGMKQYIDMARKLDAAILIGWARGVIPPGGDVRKYMNRLGRNMQILDAYAADQGVEIDVEVINHFETNIFNTAQQLLDFILEYELQHTWIHLDTFHMNIEEPDFEKAFRTAAPKLRYIHVADNSRWYPGSGTLDWQRILQILEEIGYDGYLSLECFPHEDGVETARLAIESLNRMMAKAG